jgi:hypothetical protein
MRLLPFANVLNSDTDGDEEAEMPAYCSTSKNRLENIDMAKIKNTGGQPRGFNTEDGGHVVVRPGEEKEFNMTEADFRHLQQTMEDHPDPKPFEVSGSHGGVKSKKDKAEGDDEHNPAQSVEPPTPSGEAVAAPPVTPMTEKERREREQHAQGGQGRAAAAKKDDDDDDKKPQQRGR